MWARHLTASLDRNKLQVLLFCPFVHSIPVLYHEYHDYSRGQIIVYIPFWLFYGEYRDYIAVGGGGWFIYIACMCPALSRSSLI